MTDEMSKKGYTPPKGRPTRGRSDTGERRRAFGPVAQWITLALAVVLAVVVMILITNGGDFNPLNDDSGAPPVGRQPVVGVGDGSTPHWM